MFRSSAKKISCSVNEQCLLHTNSPKEGLVEGKCATECDLHRCQLQCRELLRFGLGTEEIITVLPLQGIVMSGAC